MCCDDDAFLLPKPLDDDRLSGDASCGGGGGSAPPRGLPCRGTGRALGLPGGPGARSAPWAAGSDRRRNGDGGVGNEPSPELGNGTELRSDTWRGDQGVQATAHGGQGGQGGQGMASAGDEARNSGGAAAGCSGARRRGRKPPSSEEEGAGDGATDGAADDAGDARSGDTDAQYCGSPPHRDAGHIQFAVNFRHFTKLDIPLSLNLKGDTVRNQCKRLSFTYHVLKFIEKRSLP